ncbi:MAG: P-loop domain-containing protein, partial [Myxococcota bacterium]
MSDLRSDLERIDRRPYGFYKDLRGRSYAVGTYTLRLDHVQGDPFAAPSRVRVEVPAEVPRLPAEALADADARRASADYLQRVLVRTLSSSRRRSGSGKSGLLEVAALGQEMLDRTGVSVGESGALCIRLFAGLPASGRRILGHEAASLLVDLLPELLDSTISSNSINAGELMLHVEALQDQVALRAQLTHEGLVAFLAEGSILPRRSGADDRPLRDAVPLECPSSLERELRTPHSGTIRGLGIPAGVTLIVGGGYHGKSTLLSVLALGVYDHIPGDGRER